MNRRHLLRSLLCYPALLLVQTAPGRCQQLDDQPVETEIPATPHSTPTDLPTCWIIGDSTVKVGTPGQRGWGDEITPFFNTTKIRVLNRAIGGRSSRTFLSEGRWDAILKELKPGDFVIMQFGHNDASPINEDPPIQPTTRSRGVIRNNSDEAVDIVNVLTGKAETVRSYGWYLRHFANSSLQRGAMPVICSPIPRKQWDAQGKIARTTHSWSLWARQAASQTGAAFIDLNEIIATAYERIGPAAVEPLFADRGTHTSKTGAAFNARAVVSGLRALPNDPFHFAWSDLGHAVPPGQP